MERRDVSSERVGVGELLRQVLQEPSRYGKREAELLYPAWGLVFRWLQGGMARKPQTLPPTEASLRKYVLILGRGVCLRGDSSISPKNLRLSRSQSAIHVPKASLMEVR